MHGCFPKRENYARRGRRVERTRVDSGARRSLARLLGQVERRWREGRAWLLRAVLRSEQPPVECQWLLQLLSRLDPRDFPDQSDKEWIAWAARQYRGELQLVGKPRKCVPPEPAEIERQLEHLAHWF